MKLSMKSRFASVVKLGTSFLVCVSLNLAILLTVDAQEPPTVIILADDAYPPYSFVEDDQIKGIYVEILQTAAEALAEYYHVEIKATPWQRGLKELREGSAFALIPPYKHPDKRPYIWPYSIPLLEETVVTTCHEGIDIFGYIGQELNSLATPIKVGVNAGYQILSEELTLARKKGTINFQENKDTQSNVLKLLLRRIDCYLNDRSSTLWEIKRLNSLYPEKSFSKVMFTEPLVVMVRTAHIGYTDSKGHKYDYKEDFVRRMDSAIKDVQSSPVYKQIIKTYEMP